MKRIVTITLLIAGITMPAMLLDARSFATPAQMRSARSTSGAKPKPITMVTPVTPNTTPSTTTLAQSSIANTARPTPTVSKANDFQKGSGKQNQASGKEKKGGLVAYGEYDAFHNPNEGRWQGSSWIQFGPNGE